LSTVLAPKLRVIRDFLLAQGLTLLGNLLYGLFCIRMLPTTEYAKFVVLFGVQGTFVVLMDIGISTSLLPLIGERFNDHKLIADYVATLRKLARQVYYGMAVALVVVYPYLVKNRGWSPQTIVAMIVTLLVSTWFMRSGAVYGAVLIVKRDRRMYYLGNMISSLGTLLLIVVIWLFHALNAWVAIELNVLGIVFVGAFYYFRSLRLLGVKGEESKSKRDAIIRLALPNVPQTIFYALQGQVALFLITFFGHTTSVASIGALARLGNIFALFGQMNPLIIEPYFAKLRKDELRSRYLMTLPLLMVLSVVGAIAGYLYPEFFLWILGPQYSSLKFEVVLVLAANGVSIFSSTLWTIHSSRRFVYWWNNLLNIVLVFAVQLAFVMHVDLGTVRAMLWMTLATNTTTMLVNVACGVYGFIYGPREAEIEPVAAHTLTLEEAERVETENTMNAFVQEMLPNTGLRETPSINAASVEPSAGKPSTAVPSKADPSTLQD
jgi:O-antigen/teichoic acid export membrane protein